MRFTKRQRELAALAVGAGIVALLGEWVKPRAQDAFKAKRRRIPQ